MQPTVTLDPRDPWALPRRMEIFRYAKELGIAEIVEAMPKELMVKRLKARGIQPPKVPPRPIGKNLDYRSGDTSPDSHHYNGSPVVADQTAKTVEIDADDLLEAEWRASQQPKKELGFMEMRSELKKAGVKLNRRWRLPEVKAEWEKMKNGENAS